MSMKRGMLHRQLILGTVEVSSDVSGVFHSRSWDYACCLRFHSCSFDTWCHLAIFCLRINVLDEEKGAEAFFSLAITSYSYAFCVQTVDQALMQWGSIITSAFGVAEFLVEKMEKMASLPQVMLKAVGHVVSFVQEGS